MKKRVVGIFGTKNGTWGRLVACLALLVAVSFAGSVDLSQVAGAQAQKRPSGKFVHPDLSGMSVTFADGAPPEVTDTQLYLMKTILQSWGARVTIINETGDPIAVTVVLAGDAQVAYVSTGDVIDSKLVTFGPAQPRLDYQFVVSNSIKTMSTLPGKVFGWSNPEGVEAEMFGFLLNKYHIKKTSLTEAIAGSSSVREAALLAGKIQATFLSTSEWKVVKKTGGYHSLADMGKVAPDIADSLVSAPHSWLKKNGKLAAGIDEAWLEAAKIFNKSKAKWIAAALAYEGTTATQTATITQYGSYVTDDAFPFSADAFSRAAAKYNEGASFEVGAITKKVPLSQWFVLKYWSEAVAAVHPPKRG